MELVHRGDNMIFPHTISSVRHNKSSASNKREADTTPLTNEECFITPGKSPTDVTFLGVAELDTGLLFIGANADIKMNDVLTEDTTGEKWIVISHPRSFANPNKFSEGYTHKQVDIRRDPAQ